MRRSYKPRLAKESQADYLMIPVPAYLLRKIKHIGIVLLLIVGTNLLSHSVWNPISFWSEEKLSAVSASELYLMDKASAFVVETQAFDRKVREIANILHIPPEWLMAVMYAESKFDAKVLNYKGSGAVGLIQFMPATARELNVSIERLQHMQPIQQLEYVYLYLQQVKDRYGAFETLVDLYLGILYPKAIGQDYCYTLYAKPSQSYRQNAGLDENRDGRVTISDIDRRMKRLFPTAYVKSMNR